VSGIVTPEAVVLDFETAGIGSRFIAKMLDSLIQFAVLMALVFLSVAVASTSGRIGLSLLFISLFAVFFVYPAGFETLWRGRTPGKAAMGLRVVTVEGAPIRFRHAAIRALLGWLEISITFGSLAVITMFISSRNQRLGDLVAGTVVLRERSAAGPPMAAAFWIPPGYEPYAATLDVSGVTPADYEVMRSFLLRAGSFPAPQRYELARQIATPMLSRLRHTPPEWVGPEALLACVAAVYQARQPAWPNWAGTWPEPRPPASTQAWPQNPPGTS